MTLTRLNGINRQYGKGMISFFFIMIFVGVIGYTAIKVGPVYFDNNSIKRSLHNLATDGGDGLNSAMDVRLSLTKRFAINGIRLVDEKSVSVVKNNLLYEVSVDYEVIIPYMFNVSLLLTFNESVEVPIR